MVNKRSHPARFCFAFWLLLLTAALLPAQEYFFQVRHLKAELTVNTEGSVNLGYEITFYAEPGSHPIDIVDIGLPNDSYDLATATADRDGTALSTIRDSSYVHPGVEVHLSARTIQPGESGTLHFNILLGQMIYPDSTAAQYATLQFKTTWFGAKYLSANADEIEILMHLPPGSRPDTVRFHDFGRSDYQPSRSEYSADRVTYSWLWRDQSASQGYAAGASFPRQLVQAVYTPAQRSLFAAFLKMVLAFFSFISGLTPILIFVVIIVLALRSNVRRLKKYLPPKLGIESGGIKRGLTVPEAALLRETPLPRVLLLIIFGLVRKAMLSITLKEKQYHFQVEKAAADDVREYETDFLKAVEQDGTLSQLRLQEMFTTMIRSLQKKMAGFSRRESNAYYASLMNKAWEQIKNAPAEKLPEELAANLEWLTMDKNFAERLPPALPSTIWVPGSHTYWYHGLPDFRSTTPGESGQGKTTSPATSFVQSLEHFSTVLVGNSTAFATAITQVTNPPPVSSSSGSSGHSGGCACACACACAGCACACAGGGR